MYLRISITDRCNMRCLYCFPKGYKKLPKKELLSFEEIIELIAVLKDFGLRKIRITGGEPLLRKGVCRFAEKLFSMGIPVYISTNGALLERFAHSLRESGITRVNVSVDSLREDRFGFITKTPLLPQVLRGIETAQKAGLEVKVNSVLMKNINDDEIFDFLDYFLPRKIRLRFIEFMPFPHTRNQFEKLFVPYEEILNRISERYSVSYAGTDGVAKEFKIKEFEATVGFISPVSKPFCRNCDRLRLTASGKLKVCLHSGWEFDVKEILRHGNKGRLKEAVKEALELKAQISSPRWKAERSMVEIGG